MKKLAIVFILCVTSPVQANLVHNRIGYRLEKVVTTNVTTVRHVTGRCGIRGMQRRKARRVDRIERRLVNRGLYGG